MDEPPTSSKRQNNIPRKKRKKNVESYQHPLDLVICEMSEGNSDVDEVISNSRVSEMRSDARCSNSARKRRKDNLESQDLSDLMICEINEANSDVNDELSNVSELHRNAHHPDSRSKKRKESVESDQDRLDLIVSEMSEESSDEGEEISIERELESDASIPNEHNLPSQVGSTQAWTTDPSSIKHFDFTKEQRLLVPAPSDPYEAFRLLVGDDLLDMIVAETNINAESILCEPGVSDRSRIRDWKDLTREELLTFLGLLMHTGTIRMNRLDDYWKTHWLFNWKCFSKYMSRNKFLLILRCLNFSSTDSNDDLAKIRPIIEYFNDKMKTVYYPGKQLSLDESMVLWHGRLRFGQNKKHQRRRYGIKLHILAEPDGTILKFRACAGAGDETSDRTEIIVLKLLEEKLDNGHSVYMNKYYNSYGLAVKLLNRQTYCTGTLSKNKIDNPVELGTVTLKEGENKSLFLDGVHIGKWRDKRYVLYISTEHNDEMMESTNNKGQVMLKPKAILHFNNFMGAADLQDQMLSYYPLQGKTLRWYKKLFIHAFQMSLSNAFYLYNKFCTTEKMNLYDFRLFILEKLLPNTEMEKTNLMQKTKVHHALTKIDRYKTREKKEKAGTRMITEVVRKECKGCRAKKMRVATQYECKLCEGSPGYCTECFFIAHA